jgi:hypothetical protein
VHFVIALTCSYLQCILYYPQLQLLAVQATFAIKHGVQPSRQCQTMHVQADTLFFAPCSPANMSILMAYPCLYLAFVLQVWTAHESAARELMSLELEDMRAAVDRMSDEELAQVAMRMMAVS